MVQTKPNFHLIILAILLTLIFSICTEISCPKVGNLPNGYIVNYFDPSYGQKVFFQCHENFRLINASEIICGENGQWSSLQPHCAREYIYRQYLDILSMQKCLLRI